MKSIVFLVFAGCVSAQYIPRQKYTREKPGTCPVSDIITTCECRPENIVCKGDNQCPRSQKCCSYGCGCRTRCVEPVREGRAGRGVCSLPKVVGPCRAAFPRFWYNSATRRCERFIYGGCRGNGNNFETLEACQRRCQRDPYRP